LYLILLAINKANGWQLIDIKEKDLPFVSIVIPTLDEENNIGRCLDSILALDYPRTEIILVDGGSRDNTIQIAENYPIRIIVDPNLPEGWVGKTYGCHVAYLATKGDLLLFTDADTVHTPGSLKIAVSNLIGTESSLLSIYPYQICEKWYEYFISYFYQSVVL
jgi:glycosyltransferase involved in cell wall biosynthesis